MTPATRQKAGRLPTGLPPGGVNSPAARDSAVASVTCGSVSVVRRSQGVGAPCSKNGRVAANSAPEIFMERFYSAGQWSSMIKLAMERSSGHGK